MRAYILKRLVLMVPTLLGITLLTYAIVRLTPGDPIEAMIRLQAGDINPQVMAKEADAIRRRLGLDDVNLWGRDPEHIDPAERLLNVFYGYARWIGNMAGGDFGESIKYSTSGGSKNPLNLYLERIPVSLPLNLAAEVVILLVAVPVGLASARFRGRLFDRASTFGLLALWSVPVILAGTLALGYLARGGRGWHLFPFAGLHSPDAAAMTGWAYFTDVLWHATLPVACLVYGGLAYLAKLGRASLLENIRADYVRTARAKGLSERRVVYHHALRNSLIPMITSMVTLLPFLIGGSVVVETIFSIRGMGLLVVGAAKALDLSVIMFGTLIYGTLTLGALLIGDVLYAWVDPRVRFE